MSGRFLSFCSHLPSVVVCVILLAARGALAQPEQPPSDGTAGSEPVDQAAVVPPKLVKFQDATYPPEARRLGLTADVILRLTIDDTGAVTDAEVVQAAGHGFDEAAQRAALGFVFEPARRNQTAIRSRILFKYSFTLEPKEPAQPPEQVAKPALGNLSGVVRIAETDVPMVGAEVTVRAPDGQERTLVTDAQGRFELLQVEPGIYRVSIAGPGFEPVQSDETVEADQATDVTYRMYTESDELEVTVRGERPPREVTRRTIERREIERIPGTSGDALRSLESLPGVSRPPGLAGFLIVRGSYPDDTQIYVDGSEIPIIYHFGGLRSVLPTETLDRIDFYPGNYGARFGRGMGGIVDVGLRSPDTSCSGPYGRPTNRNGCFNALAQVDLLEGRFLVQGPLPIKGWTFLAGGRRSWVDAWIGPVLESTGANVTTLPVYYDYQAIAENKPTRDSRVSLRFFGADDRFAAIVDPLAQEPGFGGKLAFAEAFYQGQLLYENQLTPDVSLTSMLSAGKTLVNFSVGTFSFDVTVHPIQLRQEFGWKLAKGAKINTGFDYVMAPYDIAVRAPRPPRPGEPDSGPFSTRPPLEVQESRTALRTGWYTDAELQPDERLRIVPGMRVDYARDTGKTDLSPRINARYDIVKGKSEQGVFQRRTTIKGGAGYYFQPPQFDQTNSVFGTPGLSSNQSIHYSLGVEQELTEQIDVSVEGFYKDLTDLVAAGIGDNPDKYTNLGTGRVVGLETLLRYKPDRRFFGWIAYTLSRSERRDDPSEASYLIPYDQTHNLTVLGSYRLGRGWEFGARFRLVSGSMVTPVRRPPDLPALYAADAGTYVPLQGAEYSERLPLFHQLDMRLDKRWQFQSWRLGAYLDVYNVYNNPGIEDNSYDFNYTHRIYQTGVPFLPSVGLRGEF